MGVLSSGVGRVSRLWGEGLFAIMKDSVKYNYIVNSSYCDVSSLTYGTSVASRAGPISDRVVKPVALWGERRH